MNTSSSRSSEIRKVMYYVLLLNLTVAVAKILYGMYTNVLSMQSDGYHSLFDGVSNIIGLIGISIASKPPDVEHPYGHRKFETLAAVFIAFLLGAVAFELMRSAVNRFGSGIVPEVTTMSFIIMLATIAVNIVVTTYEKRKGKELNSEVLLADAAHTTSDIYVSASVILGLIAIRAGYPLADPIISLVVAVIILRAGAEIISNSASVLCDQSTMDPEIIKDIVERMEGVHGCHKIRTRGPQGCIYVDLHVEVDPKMPTYESHCMSHNIQQLIKTELEGIQEVLVHIEPANDGHTYKQPE